MTPDETNAAMDMLRHNIAGIESGGRYELLGRRTHRGDYAVGKYQVMASNVPQWTQHYLGQPMTAEQFRYNPGAQEAVFDARMRDVLQHYSPQDAASIWFTGRPLGQGGAAAMDINGMTGQRY